MHILGLSYFINPYFTSLYQSFGSNHVDPSKQLSTLLLLVSKELL